MVALSSRPFSSKQTNNVCDHPTTIYECLHTCECWPFNFFLSLDFLGDLMEIIVWILIWGLWLSLCCCLCVAWYKEDKWIIPQSPFFHVLVDSNFTNLGYVLWISFVHVSMVHVRRWKPQKKVYSFLVFAHRESNLSRALSFGSPSLYKIMCKKRCFDFGIEFALNGLVLELCMIRELKVKSFSIIGLLMGSNVLCYQLYI